MIVWSGRGFLIVLVVIVCLFLGISIFPENMAGYVFVFAGLVSAIFSWLAGIAWNTKSDRIVTDDKTGQKILLKGGRHKLFWIPMQYWGIILTVYSIIILFQYSVWQAVVVTVILCAIVLFYVMRNVERNKVKPTPTANVEIKKPHLAVEVEVTETEEERLKRRAEKEDHSRFMPK